MMILKISFVVDAIIHVNFAEDHQNLSVKHVGQIEIDIQLHKNYKKFHWCNVSVPQV